MVNEGKSPKEEVVLVVNESYTPKGEQVRIRVVKWNDGPAKIEKRRFYKDKTSGEDRMGKCLGFTAEDFGLIMSKKDEILGALK